MARSGARNWPPSEKESGVTLRTPMTAGRPSVRKAARSNDAAVMALRLSRRSERRRGRSCRGWTARPPACSVDGDDPVDRPPLGRLDQPVMSDAHRMKRAFELAPPIIEKAAQGRKRRGDVVFLPNIELQQSGMIRHAVADLRSEEHTSELQ